MSDKKSKAELFQMLAEAVRNTQPQPVRTQPEPIHVAQSAPRRRNTRPAPKRAVKIKRSSPLGRCIRTLLGRQVGGRVRL